MKYSNVWSSWGSEEANVCLIFSEKFHAEPQALYSFRENFQSFSRYRYAKERHETGYSWLENPRTPNMFEVTFGYISGLFQKVLMSFNLTNDLWISLTASDFRFKKLARPGADQYLCSKSDGQRLHFPFIKLLTEKYKASLLCLSTTRVLLQLFNFKILTCEPTRFIRSEQIINIKKMFDFRWNRFILRCWNLQMKKIYRAIRFFSKVLIIFQKSQNLRNSGHITAIVEGDHHEPIGCRLRSI